MLDVSTCKQYLQNKNITDERIKEIRDYLYAIAREIAVNNLDKYEASVKNSRKKLYNKSYEQVQEK
jgi:hypothetical protein